MIRNTLTALCLLLLAPAGRPAAAGERTPGFTVNAPVINFRIPTFTPEGFRAWLLCGAEGRYINADELAVTGLNLTVFAGDTADTVDSVFLSPSATAYLNDAQVRGTGTLRCITAEFEATGEDWLFDNRQKKISIGKNVRVAFHTPLKSLL